MLFQYKKYWYYIYSKGHMISEKILKYSKRLVEVRNLFWRTDDSFK